MSSVSNPQDNGGVVLLPSKSEAECLAAAARTYAEYLRTRNVTVVEVAA